MELESLIGSKIISIHHDGTVLTIKVVKNGKKYTITCEPIIDATYDDCIINDEECYDLLISCRVMT